ncbi:Transcription factor IWS1 [Cyberlindnera fabianii]|uniref:Transcription factor IWS1 n=1 Tax=Cyberlindnera fabianii TaxID=36022 RepID=A0A1V2LD50_CYBFA|nr:Transcription factor IWS1 [Cyberlindnera fabianii]
MSDEENAPVSKSAEPEQIEGDDNEQVVPENFDESTKRRQELEAKLERALKRPKIKRRKDEHDLTNDDDELIQILKQQMDTAAKQDAELIESETGVAMNKIQLLPKVRNILSKANLAEVILDNNLLAEVRQWLEPLPNASLPSYEIQKTLFAALLKLPINTNHLRESGIGKILLFYQKSKRVEPDIKRVADKLVSDWTRPIIGASDNYRDKRFSSVEFDAAKLKEKMNRPKKRLTEEEKKRREAEKSIYEQQAARRNRAAAPAPTVTDYKFAPKSRVDKNAMSITQAGVGSSLNRDDQFKRIKAKLSGRRAGGSKKGGISIEGRGTQGF